MYNGTESFHKFNQAENIMKKTIGPLLTLGGIGGLIYFSYRYYQETQSFNIFGADVAVSTGDVAPIVISILVIVIGYMYMRK